MTTLAILLNEGFADWECAHLMAAGRSYFGIAIVVATPGGTPVTSSGGLHVTPDADAFALDPAGIDGIAICGGAIWQGENPPDIAPIVARFTAAGKVVAGICAGTLALARTGALDAVAHTGNALDELKTAPSYAGAGHYVDTPRALRTGKLVTAAGLAPVSFMAAVLEALGYGGEDLDAYVRMLGAEHAHAA